MKQLLFLLVIFFSALADITFALPNPAAAYCTQLGYNYQVVKTSQGEHGECILPDKSRCDEWQFLEGKCGNSYSYCIKNGYNIKTVSDGKNSYSSEYAVCVPKIYGQKERNVTDFITIKSDIASRTTTESSAIKTPSPATSAIIASTTSLPSSFDWRNNNGNWMTPVKNQGSCGTCYVFAAVGAVESKLKIEKNTPSFNPDLSEQDIISCHGYGCSTGGQADYILQEFYFTGVVDESCFPYASSDAPCSNRCSNWKDRLTKIADYEYIPPGSDIKSYLIQNGPLTTHIAMKGSFDNNGIYKCDGSPQTDHAIVLVGYNDAGGYWIAKNSWGDTWLKGAPYYDYGYFKIYYGSCSISSDFYVYATGQKNGICNKDVGASSNCDGKLPSSSWCDGPIKKSCDSVCQYSDVCDSTSCSSTTNCNGRVPSKTWCDGNIHKGCDSSCQYSQTNCMIQLSDTDGGINPLVKGTCYDYKGCIGFACSNNIYTDICLNSTHLAEYYIAGSSCVANLINCKSYGSSYYCSDSTCKQQSCNLGNACDGLIPDTGCCVGCYFTDITGLAQCVPDGKVDIRDTSLVAKYFGQNVSPASSCADINGDKKVDIKDVGIVAKGFGKICPLSTLSTIPKYTLSYEIGTGSPVGIFALVSILILIEVVVMSMIIQKLTLKNSNKK